MRSTVYVVELSSSQHIDDLLPMALAMRNENFPNLPHEDAVVAEFAHASVHSDNMAVFLAYTQDHEPCGFIVCILGSYMFNRDKFAMQQYWYVDPKKRRTGAAKRLMKAYDDWVAGQKEYKVLEQRGGVIRTQADEVERISKLFDKLGYDEVGRNFTKRG